MKVIIENFQTISHAELNFVVGINHICGLNGSGKSSIIEAIRCAILNPSGTSDVISWWAKEARVTLEDDNNSITWVRTKSSSCYIDNKTGTPINNASKLNITVFGNTDLRDDNFVTLKVINASDYSIADNITSTGIYWADLNGIRKCYVVINSITGECNVKGMTKSGLTTDLVARAMAAQGGGGGSQYELPVATTSTLGGIKASETLGVEGSGTANVVGVKDIKTNNTDKFWTGTKDEYNAITNKDENTFYAITDDSSSSVTNLTEITGYDATKTQILKNISGTLTWVDEV